MARLKQRRWGLGARTPRPTRAAGVEVTLQSTGRGFRGCARVKSKIGLASWNAPKGYYVCALGTNPRKAMAAALRALAKKLGKRKGAFAGLKP